MFKIGGIRINIKKECAKNKKTPLNGVLQIMYLYSKYVNSKMKVDAQNCFFAATINIL
jgi:hypothetical protein